MSARSHISLFLTLCFSVFLGHNLTPHHHHAEPVNGPIATDCPIDHQDHSNHDQDAGDHPLHCHAFNDVLFHKYGAVKLPLLEQELSKLLTPLKSQVAEASMTANSCLHVQLKIPDKASEYFGARSLRAPPPLALI